MGTVDDIAPILTIKLFSVFVAVDTTAASATEFFIEILFSASSLVVILNSVISGPSLLLTNALSYFR